MKGERYVRESSKASLCGVVSALAVIIMLCTYLSPFLVYTAPAFSGLLLLIIVNELGIKWALGTYFSISMLSFFVISDKEAAVFFTMFFGYFPILVHFIEQKMSNSILKYLIEFIVFNFSCLLSLVTCFYVFGIGFEDFSSDNAVYNIIFVLLMNALFFVYDILIKRLQELYERKFRKFLKKLFNLK